MSEQKTPGVWWSPTDPLETYAFREDAPTGAFNLKREDGSLIDIETHDVVGDALVENPSKVAAKNARLQVEAVKTTIENRQAFGRAMILRFMALNESKNPSVAQAVALAQKTAGVIQLLQLGSLETARAAMAGIEPDEFVTSEIITEFRAEIAAFLGIS